MQVIESSAFYVKVDNYLKTIGMDGRDWDWLRTSMQVEESSVRSWRNGNKIPSLDNINRIACLLKDSGVNIWTPKQLMPNDMEFNLVNQVAASNNIAFLMNHRHVTAKDIYDSKAIPKNTVNNVLRGIQPSYKTIVAFANYFSTNKALNAISPVDLIYFPIPWGEKELTFLDTHKKIKIVP